MKEQKPVTRDLPLWILALAYLAICVGIWFI